jgi:hypothetical protein
MASRWPLRQRAQMYAFGLWWLSLVSTAAFDVVLVTGEGADLDGAPMEAHGHVPHQAQVQQGDVLCLLRYGMRLDFGGFRWYPLSTAAFDVVLVTGEGADLDGAPMEAHGHVLHQAQVQQGDV